MAEIPLDDEEDFDTSAMAAAMGFSSFGAAPASKKRKFNPRADAAFVASSGADDAPAPAPSGANTTALGARQPRAASSSSSPTAGVATLPARPSWRPQRSNTDEIDLDDEDPDDDVDPEPQYIDTSRPARRLSSAEREARETQERIDAIVTARVDETMAQAAQTTAAGGAGAPSLPAGQSSAPGSGGEGGGGYRQRGGHHGGGGQYHPKRGEPGHVWWEGYHDPSFNYNPWEWLEKARGLEPRGTWVPRVARSG